MVSYLCELLGIVFVENLCAILLYCVVVMIWSVILLFCVWCIMVIVYMPSFCVILAFSLNWPLGRFSYDVRGRSVVCLSICLSVFFS